MQWKMEIWTELLEKGIDSSQLNYQFYFEEAYLGPSQTPQLRWNFLLKYLSKRRPC